MTHHLQILVPFSSYTTIPYYTHVANLRSRLFGPERNLSEAAKYMALGAEKGCGRCFFYLGAMLALGEPETNLSARFKVLPGGNIEFRCHG